MVHDNAVSALLGLQVETFCEPHTDVLLGLEQTEDLRLIFEIGAGRVAEGVTGAAILLVKEIGDSRRVFAGDAEKLARLLVRQFGQRLSGFHREAVQIKVLGKVAGLEEPGRLAAGFIADGDDGEADNIALGSADRLKKVGDGKPASLRLARKCNALQLALGIVGIEYD